MSNTALGSEETPVSEDNDDIKVLRPHNKLRNIHDLRTLLVIAAEGCLKVPEDLKTFTEGNPRVNVRYTSKLPLVNYDKHPPVDAIALVCKVYCQDSLNLIERCIPLIDVRYFAGKCFLLAVSDVEYCEEDTVAIYTLAEKYNLPLHFTVKKKGAHKDTHVALEVPSHLLSIYCPPVGCNVSTSLILAAMSDPLL